MLKWLKELFGIYDIEEEMAKRPPLPDPNRHYRDTPREERYMHASDRFADAQLKLDAKLISIEQRLEDVIAYLEKAEAADRNSDA